MPPKKTHNNVDDDDEGYKGKMMSRRFELNGICIHVLKLHFGY